MGCEKRDYKRRTRTRFIIIMFSLLVLPAFSLASQITIGLVDQTNFCLMVPPKAGQNIGDTEGSSVSKCFGTVPGSDSAGSLPSGFIQSAHVTHGSNYVQVTGSLNIGAYGLSSDDGGGEYDSNPSGSRPGSACAGFSNYIEYIEPDSGIYCLRCCYDGGDCDSSQDTAGCVVRVGGNYGPGFDSDNSPRRK